MDEEKTYYKYEFVFDSKNIDVIEVNCYVKQLNETGVFIDNHGVYNFYMYSDSKDNVDTFLHQISKILSREMDTASHLYRLASGRFSAFDDFWKEYTEK